MDTQTTPDYFEALFSGNGPADPATDPALDAVRVAAVKAQVAEDAATARAMRCPRCSGEGRLSAFSHIKAGVSFTCGGSGQRAAY